MKRVEFNSGRITQNILLTALPMLVAQVLHLLYNIVDRIYIGRIPGEGTEALGAVGLCFPVIMVITGFTNMFGMGGSPLFSMAMGSGDRKKAGEILNTAFRLILTVSVLIIAIGEIFGRQLLTAFGAGEAEMVYSLPYLRIYLIGTAFSMIAGGMNPYINAQGYSLIGMMTVTVGAVSNLVLDPVFIFQLGMGVEGAAIATVIAQGLSAALVLFYLLGKRNEHPLTIPGKGKLFPHAGDIISLGLAPFIMQATNSAVQIACNSTLMHFGGSLYVSVMTIVSSVRQILEVPISAFGEGASPTISFNFGAKRPKNVRKAIFVMLSCTLPYTLAVWLMILWRPQMFIRVFTRDPALITAAVPALHIYFFAFIFQTLQYSAQMVFKALNKKKRTIFFSLFRKIVLVVPLTFILAYSAGLGTDGVFMAEPISNVTGGMASFVTMLATIMPELARMEADLRKAEKA